MKFIDERGRFFGKINVIDFLVVVFLFGLLPMFYFGYKIYMRRNIKVEAPRVFIDIERDFNLIKIKPEILKLVSVGDKEIDENGQVLGEIVWLGESRPYQYTLDLGAGNIITKEDQKLKELPVRLKIKAEIQGNSIYYKDKQIVLNSPIDFSTSKYKLQLIVEKKIEKTEKMTLNLTLKNLTEDEIRLISVGDKEIDNKDVVAEILKIGRIEDNVYEINLGGGNFITAVDNTKKQINVMIKLKCEFDENGQIYFEGQKLTYNNLLVFKTPKYTVEGKLASLLTSEKWIDVKVRFTGVIPELANIVSEGDVEKNPEGKLAARLKRIISNRHSDVLTIKENKYIAVIHPFQRDIESILNLLCIEKDGVLYFKNFPVKIGNMITFTTDAYSITGVIIGLETE